MRVLEITWPFSHRTASWTFTLKRHASKPYEAYLAPQWEDLPASMGEFYPWDPTSLILRSPPFFTSTEKQGFPAIKHAAPLLVLGDGVTTDHISPIGRLSPDCPASDWLRANGWRGETFGSYGDFRGNHEVMLRGTFDNARLNNALVTGEGNRTLDSDGRERSIFDAAMSFSAVGTPIIVWAGEAYGTGSARDWAAKGTALLGVCAVIARSFERIHRSNLVAMGVLPIAIPSETSILPGPGDRITITGLEQLAVRSRLEILIDSRKIRLVGAVAELHTAEEVQVLLQGGVPGFLAEQTSATRASRTV